jgi:acyl carrier protein
MGWIRDREYMETKILALIAASATSQPSQVSLGDTLESLDWDSLATLEFIARCDSELKVILDADEVRGSKLVSDLVKAVTEAGSRK